MNSLGVGLMDMSPKAKLKALAMSAIVASGKLYFKEVWV
jgi:hypothetical protein